MPSIRILSFVAPIAVAGTLVVPAIAQEQKAPSSGIYVEAAGSQSEVRLPSARFDIRETGIGKSMATMGFTKPQMHGVLNSPTATTRVAPDATFRIQLSQPPATPPQNMSPQEAVASMMGMMNGGDGSIPSTAKGPNDFALVKLTAASDSREANFGAAGATRPKDEVDVTFETLGQGAFRVKPRHPLAPGEYALYVRMGNSPAGPAYDFGVDRK
jgi:hypothetical protein